MMRPWILIGIVLLALTADLQRGVGQQVTPADRLRMAEVAEEKLTLRGTLNTVTFFAQGSISSEVVVCRKPGRSRWEYRSPALKGMVIIEKGDTVTRLDPSSKTAYVGHSYREPGHLELLLRNYRPMSEGEERVAGRLADIVAVRPRRPGSPSKKVWIDRATGLVLRSEYYNSEGKLSSLTFYTDIAWNPRLDDSLFAVPESWRQIAIQEDGEQHRDRQTLSREVGFPIREPSYHPPGYILDGFYLYRCRCGVASAHLRYVDGLNSFSVFERFTECPRGHRGRGFRWGQRQGRQRGCELFDNRRGKLLVKRRDGLMFILVGDLPEEELQKIADGIR